MRNPPVRPFGDPEHVLRYLGAYTHRVAISNSRLVALSEGNVTFRWRDSAHGNKKRPDRQLSEMPVYGQWESANRQPEIEVLRSAYASQSDPELRSYTPKAVVKD
jgi:hypothetical protein